MTRMPWIAAWAARAGARVGATAMMACSALVGVSTGCATAGGGGAIIQGSHPSRLAALEAPATVRQGSVAVAASAGGDFGHYGGFDSRDVRSTKAGGGGRVRIGAIEGMEMQFEGAAVRWRTSAPICRQDPISQSINGNLYMGRGGFKFSPHQTRRFLALTTGIGGGRGPTGTYLAPDLGLSLGLEGGSVVPFAHFEVIGSFPISKHPATAALCHTNKYRVDTTFDPQNNVMGRATLGIKIPLPEAHRGKVYTSANIYLAGMINVTPTVTGGVVGGLEVIFGKRSRHGR